MANVKIEKDGQRILPYHRRGTGKTGRVPGLNKLAPLGSVEWGGSTVYSAPSIAGEEGKPPRYYYYQGDVASYHGENVACLGTFLSKLTDEEQEEFVQNAEKIFELLGVKHG